MSYAWLGEYDRAFAAFGTSIDERSINALFLKTEWLPASFIADARFRALLRRIGQG
jgi:hypothetical protein